MEAIGQLDPYFRNLVQNLMVIERQPLERLTTARDTLNVRRAIYSDLSASLRDFQSLTRALLSTEAGTAMKAGRKVSITNLAANTTVLTATVTASAAAGSYSLTNIIRAKAHRTGSAVMSSADSALGRTGNFWLGGTGTASASVGANSTITGAGKAGVVAGLRELGTGAYAVETRDNAGVREFRVKDADGRVLAIADKTKTDNSVTTGWQAYTAGETYDTKRGLTLTFGSGTASTTNVNYTAAGVNVVMEAGDSLISFAAKINAAQQPEGHDLTAAVVGRQLTLTAVNTGTTHSMLYTDQTSNGGFGLTQLQAAVNASFRVNGLTLTRASNTNLTDVIHGATLNLADDAEGKTATLNISTDMSGARSAIDAFVSKFNAVVKYIDEKTAITSSTLGTATTYRRGALADDSSFGELRGKLFSLGMSTFSNSGAFQTLRQIGLSINDNLELTVDGGRLDGALANNFDSVKALFDGAMSQFDTTLARFTGVTSGYMDTALKSLDTQITDTNGDIADFEQRVEARETLYVQQFGEMQAQLYLLQYQQQTWAGIYGSTARFG
jgi:flagellar capping protein FliD